MPVCVHERPDGVGRQKLRGPAEGHSIRSDAGADTIGDRVLGDMPEGPPRQGVLYICHSILQKVSQWSSTTPDHAHPQHLT